MRRLGVVYLAGVGLVVAGNGALLILDQLGYLAGPLRIESPKDTEVVGQVDRVSTHSVDLANTSGHALTLVSMGSSCKCIEPQFTPTVVEPSGHGLLTFRVAAAPGLMEQWVSLKFKECTEIVFIPIHVYGIVSSGLYVTPNIIKQALFRSGVRLEMLRTFDSRHIEEPECPLLRSEPQLQYTFSGWKDIDGSGRFRGSVSIQPISSGPLPEALAVTLGGSGDTPAEVVILP